MAKPYSVDEWQRYVPDVHRVLAAMDAYKILSVGITPFTRIVPAFFLKNYSIYTIHDSADVAVMENFVKTHVLARHNPKLASRIQGTGYLLGNHQFQGFLKKHPGPLKVMFYTMTEKIVTELTRLGYEWIGNDPQTTSDVMLKADFRALLERLGLPHLKSLRLPQQEFLVSTYRDIAQKTSAHMVVQRGDKETGGNQGTFFIRTESEFEDCKRILAEDTFGIVLVSPFITGYTTSMLGCITQKGTLTGPLQLQLIDVPESLHCIPSNGIFFGNDITFRDWSTETETQAQHIVESVGVHLSSKGYRGVFGIDFILDKETGAIYPLECNPRFTGSLVLYSLMLLDQGIPPMEFFHIMEHLGIPSDFDFDVVNRALKQRIPCAHVAFSPKGMETMNVTLVAGVYEYDEAQHRLEYVGPGLSLNDITNENQFLLIDTVPSRGAKITQGVPRLFKFIFKRQIARSSHEIDAHSAFLVRAFARIILESQTAQQ